MKNGKIIFLISVILLLTILLCGCKQKLRDKIIDEIETNIKSGDIKEYCLSMKDVTDFKWDNMYIFRVGFSSKEISEIIGAQFPVQVDIQEVIVFTTNDGKIPYYETQLYDPERPYRLYFEFNDSNRGYAYFTYHNATFKVLKGDIRNKNQYVLIPVIN